MRKLGLVGGAAATLLVATVVVAASPSSPGASGAPAPTKSGTSSSTPAAGSTPPAAAAASPWSAALSPFDLQGTASIAGHANGSATLTLKMQALDPNARLAVTLYRGGTGVFKDRAVMFRWSDADIDRLGNGTLSVHLTAAEYRAITRARTSDGFVVLVSDGARDAVATFAKA